MATSDSTKDRAAVSTSMPGPAPGPALYVVRARGGRETTAQQIGALLDDHLKWMVGLERSGRVFASGPLVDDDSTRPGDGLTILRADSAAEARSIAEQDPFFLAGLRTFEVHGWRLMEGSLWIQLCVADRWFELR